MKENNIVAQIAGMYLVCPHEEEHVEKEENHKEIIIRARNIVTLDYFDY